MSDIIDLPLTPDDVGDIVALLDGSGYQSLEISTARFLLKVARTEGGGWTQEWRHSIAVSSTQQDAIQVSEPASSSVESRGLHAIHPPLPGTFYHTPQPGAPPFVGVGEVVTPDTVVGIVETMKLMTSVPAGIAGEIIEVTTNHGDTVDQSSILMLVCPSDQGQ